MVDLALALFGIILTGKAKKKKKSTLNPQTDINLKIKKKNKKQNI